MSNNQDYDRTIGEIELEQTSTAEVTKSTPPQAPNEVVQPEIVNQEETQQSQSSSNTLKSWFLSLPDIGKIAVGAIALIVSFSVLNAVLKLVTSLLTVAILAVILYGLYKLWVAPRS